jgi:hypothetical protein
MSIGNTKSDGNKGNNFPFQSKVLQGLQSTSDELKNISTNSSGVERNPGFIRVTTSGNLGIFAPLYSLSIANVGLADGLVLGSIIKPGEVLNFSADALNNFFTSFSYDGTGTELIIIYVN